jgi:S1-C subfamily serine protease
MSKPKRCVIRLILFALLISSSAVLLSCTPAFAQSANAPDMLERVIPGVVTVAVNEISATKGIFGAAGTSPLDTAYRRILDLADAKASGSGFVISSGGKKYVVTNAHVVERSLGPEAIAVYTMDQTRYTMKLAGGDSFYDIALLEFAGAQPGKDVPALGFRETEPRIGEIVYAIGNPLGKYPNSVTNGIIGGKSRTFSDLTGRLGYLQSSATITWGNSGGPLVDSEGRVVGVNTRIEVDSEAQVIHEQLNFALEAKLAGRIVRELLANNGRIKRAFIGLILEQDLTKKGNQLLEGKTVIGGVFPNSPAARALAGKIGWRVDRIGSPVRDLDEALAALESVKPDASVSLEITSPAGKTESVEIRAASLTEETLASIAQSFMHDKAAADVVMRQDMVCLTPQPVTRGAGSKVVSGPLVQYQSIPKSQKQVPVPTSKQGSNLRVVAVGIIVESEDSPVYRIGSLANLGAAIKLVSTTGRIDFLVNTEEGGDPIARSLRLSGREDMVKRTLIY